MLKKSARHFNKKEGRSKRLRPGLLFPGRLGGQNDQRIVVALPCVTHTAAFFGIKNGDAPISMTTIAIITMDTFPSCGLEFADMPDLDSLVKKL